MTEQELKQRFFAQYLGVNYESHGILFEELDCSALKYSQGSLILKDLAKITDEDALKADLVNAEYAKNKFDFFGDVGAKETDLLRSLGYLVPFMHMSIQDILVRGWAKYE